MYPQSLFTIRAITFYGISIVLLIIFLGFGFGGLWKRRRYGYWLGLIFLGTGIVASVSQLAPKLYTLATGGLIESRYSIQGNQSEGSVVFDLVVQSVILGAVTLLFLKMLLGRREKLFFRETGEGPSLTAP